MEYADPYTPTRSELRRDAVLLMLAAFLQPGQLAVWEFPSSTTMVAESRKSDILIETVHNRRYLAVVPVGEVVRCTIVSTQHEIVRRSNFKVRLMRGPRSHYKQRDRKGETSIPTARRRKLLADYAATEVRMRGVR